MMHFIECSELEKINQQGGVENWHNVPNINNSFSKNENLTVPVHRLLNSL